MARPRERYAPLLSSYVDSKKINSVSEGAENLYVRLLATCDDAGRNFGDARFIATKLYTERFLNRELDEDEIERRLVELIDVELLVRYEVAGEKVVRILNHFAKLRSDYKPQIQFRNESGAFSLQNEDANGTHSERNGDNSVTESGSKRTSFRNIDAKQSKATQRKRKTSAAGALFKKLTAAKMKSVDDLLAWFDEYVQEPDSVLADSRVDEINLLGAARRINIDTNARKKAAVLVAAIQNRDFKFADGWEKKIEAVIKSRRNGETVSSSDNNILTRKAI